RQFSREESPVADTEDVAPGGTPPDGDVTDALRKLEERAREKSYIGDENWVREADAEWPRRRAEHDLEQAEQDAAQSTAHEAKERQARWQEEEQLLAREAEERRARGEAEYERAEQDAAARMAREAKDRQARWQEEEDRLAREEEERRAWRAEYERAEREAQA